MLGRVPKPPPPVDALPLLLRTRTQLSRALVTWAGSSVVLGAVLWLTGRRTRSELAVGVGRQAVAWGAVDLAVAGAGRLADRRPVTDAPAQLRSLRRLLWLNAGLDVGYLAGAALIARRTRRRPDAAGVAVQATALLVIDTLHARRLGRR